MQSFYNTSIHYGIELILLSALVLLVGLIKPKWIFLWMDKPGRMPAVVLAMAIFMAGATLFGEGNRQAKLEKAQIDKTTTAKPGADVAVNPPAQPADIPKP